MNKFSSLFSQLLGIFPRLNFGRLVRHFGAEYHCRGFHCWDQVCQQAFLPVREDEHAQRDYRRFTHLQEEIAAFGDKHLQTVYLVLMFN